MTGIMTRRIAVLFVAVVAGDYAALMLIDGRLIDFGVAATICAGSSVASGVMAYVDRRRRTAVARRGVAVPEHADLQAATIAGQQCPLCGGARQTRSDSPRFADRQESRLCGACAPTQSRHDEPTAGPGASSVRRATRSGAPGEGKPRLGATWNRVGWHRTPDDPRVEVSK